MKRASWLAMGMLVLGVVACSSSADSSGSGDAGAGGGAGAGGSGAGGAGGGASGSCATLAACCPSLQNATYKSSCEAGSTGKDEPTCAAFLGQFQGAGYCK